MKKIMFLAAMLTLLVANCALAAPWIPIGSSSPQKSIAIVMVCGSDYKTPHYQSIIEECLLKNNPRGLNISFGSAVQTKYQEYWMQKGFLEEQQPVKDDLFAFRNYLGADEVLYLFIKDPVVDKHWSQDFFQAGQRSRVSIQVNSFLVGPSGIIKVKAANHEDDSLASELRAKRGAFKKCMLEISNEMKTVW